MACDPSDWATGLPDRLPNHEQSPEEIFEESLPASAHEQGLLEQVKRVSPQETTVLLMGETGTGKTRLARLIHHLSPRRNEPFQVVDCGALSSGLIESELFGHVKGAFTGADRARTGKLAAAGTGTLLLDEVNSLPLTLQGKLLRAVEERVFEPVGSDKSLPVKARLIAASNVSLEEEVRAGRFRADLFYRLNVVGFFLPPLRERRCSIVPLANRLLHEFACRNRPDVAGISPAAMRLLEKYDWPGNVRDLRNAVERGVALCSGCLVEPEDLPDALQEPGQIAPSADQPEIARPSAGDPLLTLARTKDEVEVRLILEALAKHNNNRVHTARELGISRIALYKKLHKHGLMNPLSQPMIEGVKADLGLHPTVTYRTHRRTGKCRKDIRGCRRLEKRQHVGCLGDLDGPAWGPARRSGRSESYLQYRSRSIPLWREQSRVSWS